MASGSRLLSLGAPAALAVCLVFAWRSADATPGAGDDTVIRHKELDGQGASLVDLAAVERSMHNIKVALGRDLAVLVDQRVQKQPADAGHHGGLKACFSARSRQIAFASALPEPLRGRVIYVASVGNHGEIPKVLIGELPVDALVLVADAERLSDVAVLSKRIDRPVSLASAESLRALGVSCRDAKVTVSKDGKTVEIQEGNP
jgi:hypothetical protein